jgi:transposase-like protein
LAEVDILGPSDRRRFWGAQEKAALLAEVDAEGGKVRLVARRRGISESLLYNWRSARRAAAVAAGASADVEFVSVGVVEGKAPRGPALLAPPDPAPPPDRSTEESKTGSIEITLPNGARVSVDAFVNEKALSRVLRAMRGLA